MPHVTQGLISAPTSASGSWLTPVVSFSSRLWKCKPVKYAPYQPLYLILCLGFEKSALGSSATEGWAVPRHRKWPFNWGAAAFRGSCCWGGERHDQTPVKGSGLERLWVGVLRVPSARSGRLGVVRVGACVLPSPTLQVEGSGDPCE